MAAAAAGGRSPNEAALLEKLVGTFRDWDSKKAGVIQSSLLKQVLVQLGVQEATASLLLSRAPKRDAKATEEVNYSHFLEWMFTAYDEDRAADGGAAGGAAGGAPLSVMTLNLQYFATFPKGVDGRQAGSNKLREAIGGESAPDVICVQEGLCTDGDDRKPVEKRRDVLGQFGFELQVCSARSGMAQSIRDMVYDDPGAVGGCNKAEVDPEELLCNQVYVRAGSDWRVLDNGCLLISSGKDLKGGYSRVEGQLAKRSMVWVKMGRTSSPGAHVYVMCTHISGGRFEDQYFAQALEDERLNQTSRIIDFFNSERRDPQEGDVGVLVGDFNATTEYQPNGPMDGYYRSAIFNTAGVKADQKDRGLDDEQLATNFKKYMLAPFTAVDTKGWKFAYDEKDLGPTSGFGHLIDHMAVSREVKSASKIFNFTNQKFSTGPKDTELEITDHNAVQTTFYV